MSNRLSSLRLSLVLAVGALLGLMAFAAHAGGKERGRSIEFSNLRTDEVATNLQQLTNKKDSLKQLEEDLSRSFRSSFSSGSSLDAVMAPQPATPNKPAVPSKRLKELLDRKKNSYLLTPEDLVEKPTAESMLKMPEYGPDGVEKTKKTSMELYWERMDAKRIGSPKNGYNEDDGIPDISSAYTGRQKSGSRSDSEMPDGLRKREQEVRKLFDGGNPDSGLSPTLSGKRSSFTDIFGLADTTTSKEQAMEHKKLMEQFSSILEPTRPPTTTTPAVSTDLSAGLDVSRAKITTPLPLPDTGLGGGSAFGKINPVFSPASPADVNAPLPGSSVTPSLPKLDAPKAPVSPTFVSPKRPF
jgi:hypothetical protein